MSEQNPYEKLGVTEDASFEEIQDAKNRLREQYRDDSKVIESIEIAYDAIIMNRLRMRQEGKIKVPERIRFPERSETPPSFDPVPANKSPAWLQELIDTPSRADILWPAGIFIALGGLTFYENPEGSILPLAIALGLGANVYFLNRKEHRFGRSVLLTLLGLLVGIGLGTLVASLLNPQLALIGLTVEQFATLITFFVFWLVSGFLR